MHSESIDVYAGFQLDLETERDSETRSRDGRDSPRETPPASTTSQRLSREGT